MFLQRHWIIDIQRKVPACHAQMSNHRCSTVFCKYLISPSLNAIGIQDYQPDLFLELEYLRGYSSRESISYRQRGKSCSNSYCGHYILQNSLIFYQATFDWHVNSETGRCTVCQAYRTHSMKTMVVITLFSLGVALISHKQMVWSSLADNRCPFWLGFQDSP